MRSISAMRPEAVVPAIRVSAVSRSRAADWDDYVHGNAQASVYHLSAWRELIESVFGRETHYLLAEDGDRVTGLLPMVRLKSLAFGDFLVSLPYVSYGGVLADEDSTAQALLQGAGDLAGDLGVSHAEFRHLHDLSTWPARTDKVTMHLPLTGDSDALWKTLGAKRRAQIRRPLKEGAECTIGGAEYLDDFYSVFAVKYRDLGVPVYPVEWFRAVLETFPSLTRVFVVRAGGIAVAAAIVIGFNGRLEVPWASSLRTADRFGVNMYLYWNMLKYAEDEGFNVFDFGRSTEGSGTWRFKKQWGAEAVPLYWHYWLRQQGELPQLNPANPKYRSAVALWRKLPLWMANRLGPRIVRNLP